MLHIQPTNEILLLRLLFTSFKVFFIFISFDHPINPQRKIQVALPGIQQPQEQRYPFLTVRAVFSCVQTEVWLPMLGIFNARTDVNACDRTRGLYGHRKSLH